MQFCKGWMGENQGVHPHPTNKEKQGVRVGCKWEGGEEIDENVLSSGAAGKRE